MTTPDIARRRALSGRVAHAALCIVGAAIVATVLASQAGSEGEVATRLATVAGLAVVPGLALLVATSAARRRAGHGDRDGALRAVALAAAVTALGLLATAAVTGFDEPATVPLAFMAAVVPLYETVLGLVCASRPHPATSGAHATGRP